MQDETDTLPELPKRRRGGRNGQWFHIGPKWFIGHQTIWSCSAIFMTRKTSCLCSEVVCALSD